MSVGPDCSPIWGKLLSLIVVIGGGNASLFSTLIPVLEINGEVIKSDRQRYLFDRMSGHDLTLKPALAVLCPTCGAAVGKPCVFASGAVRAMPHVRREQIAIAKSKLPPNSPQD